MPFIKQVLKITKVGKGALKSRIHKRKVRRQKLHKLRQKYQEAANEAEKKRITEKVAKIAPWLTEEEFLTPTK